MVSMGFKKHIVNGLISLIISVGVTVATQSSDDGTHDTGELVLAVSISAFLSGLFTSYFASK